MAQFHRGDMQELQRARINELEGKMEVTSTSPSKEVVSTQSILGAISDTLIGASKDAIIRSIQDSFRGSTHPFPYSGEAASIHSTANVFCTPPRLNDWSPFLCQQTNEGLIQDTLTRSLGLAVGNTAWIDDQGCK